MQLHARYYGRGPTKAKTHLVDDTLVCTLRDGFTTVEKTLVKSGETKTNLRMRHRPREVL